MKTRRVIEQCARGRVASDIIREVEESCTDIRGVMSSLLADARRLGVAIESKDLRQQGKRVQIELASIDESERTMLSSVVDVYARIYSDLDFLYTTKSNSPKHNRC